VKSRQAFEDAKIAISRSHEKRTNLSEPFLTVLPVTGAAVSVLVGTGQSTVSATDAVATRLDEIQFDLGEGPCWDAMSTRSPVLNPDFASEHSGLWPLFREGVRRDPLSSGVRALFAFPLYVGSLNIGAVDLYADEPRELQDLEVERVSKLAELASWQVLRRIIGDDFDADDLSPLSRREVHQATGMVLAQLDITAEQAMVLLRAHAFSTGRSVRDVATDVVERRLDFSTDYPLIGPRKREDS